LGCRPMVWETTLFSVSSQIYGHLYVDNPPQFQASWQHRLFTLDMESFKKKDSFSFYPSIAVLLVFLYLIPDNHSVLLLYACAHKISLKYLFPEKIVIKICCQRCYGCNRSYKPITNTAWVHAQLCKLQKGCTPLAAACDKV
jgi:hypothetical protein